MTVVVRFAPSPTGFLHVGNLRAALINYLFAQKMGGTFMLRMDDTDHERSTSEFESGIKEDLAWLGLHYGMYARQSDRIARYQTAISILKDAGHLYPCFETQEELDFLRKRQLATGKPPIYNRAALDLSPADIQNRLDQGEKPHWRFKLAHKDVVWDDIIRGRVTIHASHISDPVLVRADGYPVYTLSSVVDDLDFRTTHIIRGEDHVTNTAVQIQIFQALAALEGSVPLPLFAHFALMVDAAGEGFSKRAGSLSLRTLRDEGIEPMALCSLMAKIGTSDPITPFFNLQDLAQEFDFAKFSRATAHFDKRDLDTLNHKYLAHLPFDRANQRLHDDGIDHPTQHFWDAIRGNLQRMTDAKIWWDVCHSPLTPVIDDANKDYLNHACDHLPTLWDTATWDTWTDHLKTLTGRKGKELFMPLRLAITGYPHGPEMRLLLPLIDRERVIQRLHGHHA